MDNHTRLHLVVSRPNNEGGQSPGVSNVLGASPPRAFFSLVLLFFDASTVRRGTPIWFVTPLIAYTYKT